MRRHRPEPLAVADEIGNRHVLAAHAHDVVVEPSLVDAVPGRLVHRLDIDAPHLDADLRAYAADLDHGFPPEARGARRLAHGSSLTAESTPARRALQFEIAQAAQAMTALRY